MALALWEKRTQRLKLCRSCALLGGQVATKKIGGDAYKPGNSETQSIFSLETWRSFLPIRMIRMIRMIPPNFSWLLDQKHVSWFLASRFFVRHLFVSFKCQKATFFFHSKTLKKTLASFGRSKVSKSHSRQIFAMTWRSGFQASVIGGGMRCICWWCRFWTQKKKPKCVEPKGLLLEPPPCPTWRPSFSMNACFFLQNSFQSVFDVRYHKLK